MAAIHHGRIKHLPYMFRPTHSQYYALDALWWAPPEELELGA
jgi:hypothetical protein